MPELPEVENLRLGLEKSILGQKILGVIVTKPKLVSDKGTIRTASKKKQRDFIQGLTGEKFLSVERRAKNLIFKLTNNKIILAHLKMTGQFVYKPKTGNKNITGGHPIEASETSLPNKHTHIIFELNKGTLYYNDIRMFGYVLYYKSLEEFEKENHFHNLGKEPLEKDFTEKYFIESLKGVNRKIKTVLMNQDIVTGVGNIYTDESLFESNIRPTRRASSLKEVEVRKLHKNIISIMNKAIKAGGSSVATYRLLDESRGNYARVHKVYGKSGENCLTCNNPLKKILINTRATVFCPICQK
ncbi:MAG: bifunctional DNA-formamidopyrimidine glycosylase/DNA-(apurinic or apyrimidinic site) lyase [Candidatus Pacebacteria bacterium]|nr:bifunctional DNA-formamidopyrimidine glycosylase/DNA-(apurinic or apyrimidinic site) lyase [Candidatus Paceibacterota bacterium]MBP9839402.1 bifunctional DNA-formamidopyrimidine glycosylase/DNA-(apurinic or apyrimidinic site) lyase [Candidatus Paceibacterota bacterium]